ncbi:MAG: tetratricopeptide repeat protein [Leptospira sp.]|jgi:tetratricopeptide (TPR) repeat protein|nr:tetratricopeptide repeat protein [Leptospira sp.]NCS95632.1 tetratricopeptide repeat protein [Leptospira sp.]
MDSNSIENKENTPILNNSDEDDQFAKIKSLAKDAYRYLDQRRYFDAKERLDALLILDPSNTYGLVGMGDLFFKTKKPEQAIPYYRSCLEQDASNKFSLMGIMNCFREMNQLNRVIEVAEEYRHIMVTDASILSRVADAHRKLKNFKESEIFYMSALQINPNDQYVIVGLGHLYFACQRYQEAIQWWEKLLITQPKNIKILTEIGNSYRKIKDFEKAIHYYEKARTLDINNFFALYGLAESYRGQKEFEKAIVHWESILSFDPDNKLIINRYADSLRGLGEYDKALECFNKILSSGDDYYASLGKAASLRLIGDIGKAEEIYQDLQIKFPMDPRPSLELADLWFHTDRSTESLQLLEEIAKKFPSNSDIIDRIDNLKSRS